MKEKKLWHAIGRGKAGWHATGIDCTSSYGSLEGYVDGAIDGALVYDAEGADPITWKVFVLKGPMLCCGLPPDGADRFDEDDRSCALMMAGPGGLEGSFRALAMVAQDASYNGLDRVGLRIYERRLRAIPGIRFGRVSLADGIPTLNWDSLPSEPLWHTVVNSEGTCLGVYGSALLSEAQELARKIGHDSGCNTLIVQVKGGRPRVGQRIARP